MKNRLSATQLKVIAILAMFCDHTAWGFVEMFSVQGQIMHVIGRLTIPIMSFFIAEGYRKTSSVRKYLYRMGTFALVSVVPFWLFFGEEYGYRQNFIFDLFLALLTLVISDRKDMKKPLKIFCMACTITVSAVIGGWPVLPICYVLIFYYGKNFRQKALMVTGVTVFLEAFVISLILLNDRFHFMSYDWKWYQWLYFLGFVLALPLLYMYNGERGKYPLGRYFFYGFYPGHFLLLYSVQQIIAGNYFNVYMLVHVVCLACAVAITAGLITSRPSSPLIACIILGVSAIMYIFGFILEIFTDSADIAYTGTVLEYFGECVVFMSFLRFMAELCRKNIPSWVYIISGAFSVVIVSMLMTTRTNGIFYTNVGMDFSGPFHRIDLSYGVGFYVFLTYMALVCGGSFIMGLVSLKKSHGIEKKRILLVMIAIMGPWAAFMIKLTGITQGYEISAVGILFSLFMIYRSIVSYGYFDSVQLAGENALHHFNEGVLVVDPMYRVLYSNRKMNTLFPGLEKNSDALGNESVAAMFRGELTEFEAEDRSYEAAVTPLMESNYVQGYMLYARDITEHIHHLREAERFAHTDALMGLSNRAYFRECFNAFRKQNGMGTMLMFDLDNFKGVNDTLGHGAGDKVLVTMAETLSDAAADRFLTCRIGGDEFCMFLKDVTEKKEAADICAALISGFADRLVKAGLAGATSMSVGAAVLDVLPQASEEDDFKNIYKDADSALYVAKNSGKATYRFFDEIKENVR